MRALVVVALLVGTARADKLLDELNGRKWKIEGSKTSDRASYSDASLTASLGAERLTGRTCDKLESIRVDSATKNGLTYDTLPAEPGEADVAWVIRFAHEGHAMVEACRQDHDDVIWGTLAVFPAAKHSTELRAALVRMMAAYLAPGPKP